MTLSLSGHDVARFTAVLPTGPGVPGNANGDAVGLLVTIRRAFPAQVSGLGPGGMRAVIRGCEVDGSIIGSSVLGIGWAAAAGSRSGWRGVAR